MRRALDAYETPPHYVTALLGLIGVPKGHVYEPCCGTGNIVTVLRKAGTKAIVTNDLDPRYGSTHEDATGYGAWGTLGYDWAITNPPFSQEQLILECALRSVINVAMLARLSFLEPTINRSKFWRRYQADLEIIVLPRYSFTGEGSDSMTCCWLVWRRDAPRVQPDVDRISFIEKGAI